MKSRCTAPKSADLGVVPVLLFPGGNDLLAAGVRRGSPNFRFFRINVASHEAVDLGEVSGNHDCRVGRTGEHRVI